MTSSESHLPNEVKVMCRALESQADLLREVFAPAHGASRGQLIPRWRESQLLRGNRATRNYRRRLFALGIGMASMNAEIIFDHVSAVASLLRRETGPLWSHQTLGRASIEAALRSCEMLDCDQDVKSNVALICAVLLDHAEEQKAFARQFSEKEVQEADRQLTQIKARVKRAGLETESYKGRVRKVRLPDGKWNNCTFNMTDLSKKWTPEVSTVYTLGSGATHGSFWMTIQNFVDNNDGGGRFQASPDSIASAVLGIVVSITAMATTIARLYDGDIDSVRSRGEDELRKVVAAVSSRRSP